MSEKSTDGLQIAVRNHCASVGSAKAMQSRNSVNLQTLLFRLFHDFVKFPNQMHVGSTSLIREQQTTWDSFPTRSQPLKQYAIFHRDIALLFVLRLPYS